MRFRDKRIYNKTLTLLKKKKKTKLNGTRLNDRSEDNNRFHM